MLSITPARPRARTRGALLAAALPAAIAAVALPSAAQAATVELVNSGGNGVVRYSGEPGEVNNAHVSLTAAGIVINDLNVPVRTLDSECRVNSAGDGICPATAEAILVFAGDRNDVIQYIAPHQGFVSGGDGADTIFGGMRQVGFGRQMEPVIYRGSDSTFDVSRDTVSYLGSSAGVRVELDDNGTPTTFDDGRPGDLEGIGNDMDVIEGSNFADTLIGSDRGEVFRGLNGNDVVAALGGDDFIDEGSAPNGADTLGGGPGTGDRISYGARTTSGVEVSLDSVRNDGAPGEQDNVGGSVEHIWGTNFRDTLTGNGQANTIDGFGGPDTIDGLGGDDTLSAGASNNGIVGGTGNDVIFARNGAIDDIDCGENTNDSDTADRDTSENRVIGCERGQVGVLRLTPRRVRAEAGELMRLRLSWRHPRAWKQLRTIELRLLSNDGIPAGEIAIRTHTGRIGADGAVKLLRKRSRLGRKGKMVTARLALRLDESLAGQTLRAEVEATDRRGRRQLERHAARIRVAS